MTRAARYALPAMLAAVGILGCSSEPSRYVVGGSVTIDGAPGSLVVVTFHSADANPLADSICTTDAAGKFTLGKEGKNTGFPAGDYKVTFSQTLVNGRPTLAGSGGKKAEKDATEKEAVAAEYRDPQTTPIVAKVGNGPNIFTFEIKAAK